MESLPLDVHNLERLLKEEQQQLHEYQTHFLEEWLARAEVDCSNAPEAEIELHDPWINVTSVTPAASTSNIVSNDTSRYLIINYGSNNYPTDKGIAVVSPVTKIQSTSPILPKYKSIVRLGPNTLAENDRTLKYVPYFKEEELGDGEWADKEDLYNELHERFNNRVADLPKRRECAERASFWQESTEYLLEHVGIKANDVLYYLLQGNGHLKQHKPRHIATDAIAAYLNRDISCNSCSTVFRQGNWIDVLPLLEKPTDDIKKGVAGLLCQAFSNITGFSIFHVVSKNAEMQQLYQQARSNSKRGTQQQSQKKQEASNYRCLICYLHDCPGHGKFAEQPPDAEYRDDTVDDDSDSDNELGHNFRRMVNTSGAKSKPRSTRCAFYCSEPNLELSQLLGRGRNDEISGFFNEQYKETSDTSVHPDNTDCGLECFWSKSNRRKMTLNSLVNDNAAPSKDWSPTQLAIYNRLLNIFMDKKRGACEIAIAMNASCISVWEQMLVDISSTIHPNHLPNDPVNGNKRHADSNTGREKPARDVKYWQENSKTHLHHERAPFVPCSHEGPCDESKNCTCRSQGVTCEHFCKCSAECSRRFKGCNCRLTSKTCFGDDRCACYSLNRECDPWLCGCGVVEVLDPANRHDINICRGRCKNAGLQRDVPKRTIKNLSEVQGWGLFAGDHIKANEFIGEYKGEIISSEESDRRGAVYHHRGLEYLFRLNKEQEIDSTRAGNKMRFINNSQLKRNINCFARTTFCAGVQRIGLYAKRDIKPGEELFFNYGYPESVTKNFWEKGEKGPGAKHRFHDDESDSDDTNSRRSKGKGKAKLIAVRATLKKPKHAKKSKTMLLPERPRRRPDFDERFESSNGQTSRKRGYHDDGDDEEEDGRNPRSKRFTPGREHDGSSSHPFDQVREIAESSNADEDESQTSRSSLDPSPRLHFPNFTNANDSADDENEHYDEAMSHADSDSEQDQNGYLVRSDVSIHSTSPRRVQSRPTGLSSSRKNSATTTNKTDTRRGGAAQKAGWITRRRNLAKRMRMEKKRDKIDRKLSRRARARRG